MKDGRLKPLSATDIKEGLEKEAVRQRHIDTRNPAAFRKIAHEQRKAMVGELCTLFPTLERGLIKMLFKEEIIRLSENATIHVYIPNLAFRSIRPKLQALTLRARAKFQ